MADVKDSIPHVVRTAHEPRQSGMWNVNLSRIEQVNSNIRLLRLSLDKDGPPLRHLPGQYIDLHIPNVPTVGGFTITSPPQVSLPSQSKPDHEPFIELAIQKSPNNPPAAFLWQDPPSILNASMSFRVGGNFAYPPLTFSKKECEAINRVVFVAGGVGINPIMSMISAMDIVGSGKRLGGMPQSVRILYSSKRIHGDSGAEEVLFEKRLKAIADKWQDNKDVDYRYTFFETGGSADSSQSNKTQAEGQSHVMRRIEHKDLDEALGPADQRQNTVVYICGLPAMTDEFVELLKNAEGMEEKRVLCEKWW